MSTPAFVPQDQNSLIPIRYYQPFDPYYYTVDNRPIRDLAANLEVIGSGGGDSGRRATLIAQMNLAQVLASLFSTENPSGMLDGMQALLSGTSLTISPGALYVSDVVSSDVNVRTVKQGLLPRPVTFPLVRPTNTGYSVNYLIQGIFTSLTSSTMQVSNVPFVDAANTFLPCLLLNGEVKLSIKNGTPGASGSQITPAADSGYTPLFVVTVPAGSEPITITLASGGPSAKGARQGYRLAASMPESADTTVQVPFSLQGAQVNPLLPLRLKFVYTSSVGGGNAVVGVRYSVGKEGSTLPALISTAEDMMPVPATANVIGQFTTVNAVVPVSAFADFVNGKWVVAKDTLVLEAVRKGASASDTATGNLTLHEVIVTQ